MELKPLWKYFRYYLLILGLNPMAGSLALSQAVLYPVPDTIQTSNPYVMRSDQYSVELFNQGRWESVFVYMMHAMHYTNNNITTSWASFAMEGSIDIRVMNKNGEIEYCKVLPYSKDIDVQIREGYAEFTIREPGQYSVEFQQGIKIDHPMLLFVDPPETIQYDSDEENVIYFGPGFHDIGNKYMLHSGQTVYMAPGAYVNGMFYSEGTENVKILGRGILSGEGYEARTGNHLISFNQVNNVVIDGITMIHAPRFNIRMTGTNHLVRNVKMMGWWFSTDGVLTGENGVVEDCFFKVNDDAIKLYNNNTTARGCVIWQMENGAPFQIGWGGDEDQANFYAYDCDVIRLEHEWDNENEAVFCAIHGAAGHKRHYLFEDIRIHNARWRIFHIITKPNRWVSWDPEQGNLSDMVFRNIEFHGEQMIPSLIKGHDIKHMIRNVRFENVEINGKMVDAPDPEQFIIDEITTRNITFTIIENK